MAIPKERNSLIAYLRHAMEEVQEASPPAAEFLAMAIVILQRDYLIAASRDQRPDGAGAGDGRGADHGAPRFGHAHGPGRFHLRPRCRRLGQSGPPDEK